MRSDFHIEFNVETFEKSDAGEGRERRIAGIVSTDHLDKQSEILLQEGLDFGPFLKSGWFNDNHGKETGAGVGYPELAELRTLPGGQKAWYVEGYLLKGHRQADDIWSMAKSLEQDGGGRHLGFSVEGSILERDPQNPKNVKRAIVREVAITRCPVNDHTQLTLLAKSLSVGHSGSGGDSGVAGAMAPITQQSLEASISPRPKAKKKKKRKLKKGEAIAFLKGLNPKVSDRLAERVVEYAARHHGG